MSTSILRSFGTVGLLAISVAASARAAVSIRFSDKDASPTATTVAPGGTFNVTVFIDATSPGSTQNPNNVISGADYFLTISPNGVSGNTSYFNILGRTSTSLFSPISDDPSPGATPVPLTIGKGADQGGDRASKPDLPDFASNPQTIPPYEVATFNLGTLAGTPAGTYTLGFYTSDTGSSTVYAGARPGGPGSPTTYGFESLGNFVVTVPEPASMACVALPAFGLVLSRRRGVALVKA